MSDDINGVRRYEFLEKLEMKKMAEESKAKEVLERTSITSPNNVEAVASKNKGKVDVLIDGIIYSLVSGEDETYMQKVAFYINKKINEMKRVESSRNLDQRTVMLLTSMNIADDYFKVLEENKEFDIKIQNSKAEIEIYKNEYRMINDENEILKAEIERLKMEVIRAQGDIRGNKNS